jgi:hypothetical protein
VATGTVCVWYLDSATYWITNLFEALRLQTPGMDLACTHALESAAFQKNSLTKINHL